MAKITHERLLELLHYDPLTGLFTWRDRRGSVKAGAIAGGKFRDKDGYMTISINRISYRAHRLAWFYMTGEWPEPQCDHRDGVTDNNVWTNLRECTPLQNHQNKKKMATNKSGHPGVCWEKQTEKWKATITCAGKAKTLGRFPTIEAAAVAYLNAKASMHTFNPTVRL